MSVSQSPDHDTAIARLQKALRERRLTITVTSPAPEYVGRAANVISVGNIEFDVNDVELRNLRDAIDIRLAAIEGGA